MLAKQSFAKAICKQYKNLFCLSKDYGLMAFIHDSDYDSRCDCLTRPFFNIVCLNTDIMKLAGSLAQVEERATSGVTQPPRGITVPPSLRSSRRQEQRTATLATVFVTRCPPATTSVSTRWPLV